MRKIYSKILIAGVFFALVQGCAGGQSNEKANDKASETKTTTQAVISTPDEAIAALKEGNKRFVEGKCDYSDQSIEAATALTKGQSPFAVVISCSDSRVPAEMIFNQGFGDLFIVRNAGNCIIEPTMQGSMDYGANHISSTKVIVVLGHSDCGAITGIVNKGDDHGHAHEHEVADHVNEMLDVITHEIPEYEGSHELNKAIKANVEAQVRVINEVPYVAERVAAGTLKVVGAYYNIEDGKVTFYN